jgi:hypothetical protein
MKGLRESKLPAFYSAQVVSVTPDSKSAVVRIAGYETQYTLNNKCNDVLSEDCWVWVVAYKGDLSNAEIISRFGQSGAYTGSFAAGASVVNVVNGIIVSVT